MKIEKLKSLSDKELIERYPFIEIKSNDPDQDDSYIMLSRDWGWFELELLICEYIKKEYDTWTDEQKKNFSIIQIKEKFGQLRFYTSFASEDVDKAIDWAENISEFTCIKCGSREEMEDGNFKIYNTKGWIQPYCRHCADEILKNTKGMDDESFAAYKLLPEYEEAFNKCFTEEEGSMKYQVERFSREGKTVEDRDASKLFEICKE